MQHLPFYCFSQGPSPTPYAFGSVATCIKTLLLPIHTGKVWQSGNLYAFGGQDQYWSLVSTDLGVAPFCAFSYQSNCGAIYSGTRAISASTGMCPNNSTLEAT